MCAIDALGIASMFGRPITVVSTDPVDETQTHVRVKPDGDAVWKPSEAVVLAACACEGPSFRGCCRVLNFLASEANPGRYLSAHPDVGGFAISIPEAVACGKAVFGDVLEEA